MRPSRFAIRLPVAFLPVAFLTMSAVLASCGDDTDKTTNQPATAPSASPSPSVSPTPSPTPSPWQSVLEYKDCPYPECPARSGFQVLSDGQFIYGGGASGLVSRADFNRLDDQARRVIMQDLSGMSQCEPLAVLPGMSSLSIDLTNAEGVIQRVYSQDTAAEQLCWLGDRGRADQLAETLDLLASRYAPGADSDR